VSSLHEGVAGGFKAAEVISIWPVAVDELGGAVRVALRRDGVHHVLADGVLSPWPHRLGTILFQPAPQEFTGE
jgi:hypothetical protein